MDRTVQFFINFDRFADRLADNITEVAADVALSRAVKRVRVDNNTLRNSIESNVRGNVASIGTDIEYAGAQEYGLPDQPSRASEPGTPKSGKGGPYTFNPFLRPAAQTTAEDLRKGKFTPEAVRRSIQESRL